MFFMLALVTPEALAQAAPSEEPVQTRTFANGLTVVAVEDDAAAVVQIALWVRHGAGDDPPGKAGLAHALARMLYRGSPALSAAGFDDVAARLGARATVTTANDYTRFALTVPADHLMLALRIEADRMQRAALATASWNAERATLMAEHDAIAARPVERLYRAVCRAASATPLCVTAALGERDDVASITVDDLRGAYRQAYVPTGATLVIAGDVRAGEALTSAEAVFGTLARVEVPPPTAAVPSYARDAQVDAGGGAAYDIIDFVYPAPGTNDARAGAFAVLDAIVGDPRSDVARALVDSGYASGYSTRFERNARGGLYHVFVTVSRNHTNAPARAAFLDAIARLRDRGISEQAVFAAKAAVLRRCEDAGDSADGIAQSVGYAIAIENVAGPGVDERRVDAATAADVAAAARTFLAVPAATGTLTGGSARDDDAAAIPAETVTDDVSRRVPTGNVIEAAWVRSDLKKPVRSASTLRPKAFTLPSGMRVLVAPVHVNPTVFISGTVETTPRFDPRGREGTGAMVARLLAFAGAKYDVTARAGVREALGADFEFGFTFRAHGRAGDLRAMLDVLADALATPAFASDDVERVRYEARDAVRDPTADDAANRLFRRLLLRRGDPAQREATDASLRAISVDDLRAYARRFVRPDLTTLAIAGDVDLPAVRDDIEATFGEWKADGRRPDVRLPSFAPSRSVKGFVANNAPRIDARFGMPLPGRFSRDYDALALLSTILAARRYPPNSAVLDCDRFRGVLEVRLSTVPPRFPRAAGTLRRELRWLQRKAVGTSELERAKSKALYEPLVAEASTAAIAERVREIGLSRLPADIDTRLPARFGAVRPNDVLRVARKYLHPSALIEVDEGPHP